MKKLLLLLFVLAFYESISAQTIVGGPITSNTTWNLAGSPYILQTMNIAVNAGVTLTIDAGVVVKFDSTRSIQVSGTIRAIGTVTQPITFTSNQITPTSGYWGYLLFNNNSIPYNFSTSSGSILQYCNIEYAGGANVDNNGAIRLDNALPYIDHCTIQNNTVPGVKCYGLSDSLYISNSTIQNNTNDTGALYVVGSDTGAVVIITNCNISNNTSNGIYTTNVNTLVKNCTLSANTINAININKISNTAQIDTIVHNSIYGNGEDGVYYKANSSLSIASNSTTSYIFNNNISNNKDNGIECNFYYYFSGSLITFTINNNTINNNGSNGINTSAGNDGYGSQNITLTISNNTINDNESNGISCNDKVGWGYNSTSNTYAFSSNSISKNQGSGMSFNFITDDETPNLPILNLQKNLIENNIATNGGGISLEADINCNVEMIMEQNIISGNKASGQGGGLYFNIVNEDSINLKKNIIFNNYATNSSAIYYKGQGKLQGSKNTIVNNNTTGAAPTCAIYTEVPQGSKIHLQNSNIYNNTSNLPFYELYFNGHQNDTLQAANNYWQRTSQDSIYSVIYDYFKWSAYGIVHFIPFASTPDTSAPITPPCNVIKADLGGGNIQITLTPNSESDLAGYKIFWGSSTGYSFTDSVNVGNVNTYILSGLSVTDTIAVTAYDTQMDGLNDQIEGHESWFTNAISKPAVTFSATPNPVCAGDTVYFNDNTIDAASWFWSFPGGIPATSTIKNPKVIYSGSGNYSVKLKVANIAGSDSVTMTDYLTVNDVPLSATITGSTTVCKGTSNVVYTISNITNAASYVWTLPNGATGESTTNSISVSFSNDAESGDIKVKGFNDCGEGAESSLSVTVITIPENAGDISGNTTVCTGQTGVSYSVPEIANATSYTWAYSGTGATITGTTNSVTIDFVAVKNNDSIVKDIDGNSYNTVTIGTQEWMKENLKTTKYNDGTAIPNITNGTTWTGLSTPAYCWYNNDAATYKNTYGALYNWYTVNSGNLCSTGWHVPTDAEWTILENYLIANGYNYDGTTSGNNYAKALASETGWTFSSNTGAVGNTDYPTYRNKSGFTALPSGFRDLYGAFFHFGDEEIWWSSNEENIDYAWNRNMASIFSYLYRGYNRKTYGFSVRCLRDTAQQDTIYATSGNLTVQGTNSCGNGTESTLAITVTSIECPTGINVVSPPNKIIIYPNPTTGQLEISVDQSIGSDYKIEVYNNLGGLMQTIIKNSINNNFSLDLTDYPGGLYLIKLSNKENFYLSKIIKK